MDTELSPNYTSGRNKKDGGGRSEGRRHDSGNKKLKR